MLLIFTSASFASHKRVGLQVQRSWYMVPMMACCIMSTSAPLLPPAELLLLLSLPHTSWASAASQHLLHKNRLDHLRVRSCVLHISCLAISFSAVLPWSCEILSYKTTWRLSEIYGNLFAKPRRIYLVVNENIVPACAAKKVKSFLSASRFNSCLLRAWC